MLILVWHDASCCADPVTGDAESRVPVLGRRRFPISVHISCVLQGNLRNTFLEAAF